MRDTDEDQKQCLHVFPKTWLFDKSRSYSCKAIRLVIAPDLHDLTPTDIERHTYVFHGSKRFVFVHVGHFQHTSVSWLTLTGTTHGVSMLTKRIF